MKTIINIFLISCFLFCCSQTLINAAENPGSKCSFTEAMTLLDKCNGKNEIFKQVSECIKNMEANDPLTHLLKGRMLVKIWFTRNSTAPLNTLAKAEQHYKKAIELAPENYEVNYYCALFYGEALKNKKKAEKFLAKLNKNPLSREGALYLKMLSLPDGNSEKESLACHFSESSIFIRKHNALEILIEIYWEKDHNLVEMAYKELLKNDKKYNASWPWDYVNYASFLIYQKNEYDKAEKMIKISRSMGRMGLQDIYDGEIAYRRGYYCIWGSKRDFKKAIKLLEKSIKLNRKHLYAYYHLAVACYYQGMTKGSQELIYKAKKYLKIQMKLNPSYGENDKYLAMINKAIAQIEKRK